MDAKVPRIEDFPPTTILNIIVAMTSATMALGLLWAASHTDSIVTLLLCAFAFSFVNNTLFSLLHESVHNSFSKNRKLNDYMGIFCSAFFPTGFTFQRICHLGHHCRNRTDHEMFEMYYKDDSRVMKCLQFYSIFTGIYWITLPIGWLLYLIIPNFYDMLVWTGKRSKIMKHTDVAMLTPFTKKAPHLKIKAELLYTLCFQIVVFQALGLRWDAWLLCYWVFGMNWGALQYADHAWSKRDIREGAWNLRVNKLVQYIFLNYHHHLAHHQHPHIPWFHLGKFVDEKVYRPSFLRIYLRMWLGPTPAEEPAPKSISPEFRDLIYDGREY